LQLICYLDNIYKNIAMNDTTIEAVYLDFAKALDKINHNVLISKLSRLGIGGKLLGSYSQLSQWKKAVREDG